MDLVVRRIPGEYVVHRLAPDAVVPNAAWQAAAFLSITRTQDELSIVASSDVEIAGTRTSGTWASYRVVGSLDFSVTGVMWRLTGPLAEAGIGILGIGTFDTDYVLVPPDRCQDAEAAWIAAGIRVAGP